MSDQATLPDGFAYYNDVSAVLGNGFTYNDENTATLPDGYTYVAGVQFFTFLLED